MDQDDPAEPVPFRGDQRGPVAEPRPGLLVELQRGFGEDLAPHPDVVRDLEAEERARLVERREPRRRGPGQGAAEHPAAAPQLDRQQRIGVAGELRPGEPDRDAAALDPAREPFGLLAAEPADIGQHDDRKGLRDQLAQRAPGDLAERLQRALEKIERAQQRLVGLRGVAGDQPDRAPPPALVEQEDPARRVLVLDLDPGDRIAEPGRQGEAHAALPLAGLEGGPLAGQHPSVLGDRANPARGAGAVIGAFDDRLDAAGIASPGAQQHRRRARAVADHVEPAVALHAPREVPRAADLHAVAEPDDMRRAVDRELFRRGEQGAVIGRPGRRLDRPQDVARLLGPQRIGKPDRPAAGTPGGGRQPHRAVLAFRPVEDLVPRRHPLLPAARGRPSIVDDQDQRAGTAQPLARVDDRAGQSEDHQQGDQAAQDDQPERRAGGRFLRRAQAEHEADRREGDQPRRRRGHPEQPPDQRQDEPGEQEPGGGKAERA